jgi:uncharacterized membrane protein YbhN (UPF0104 family)
MQKYLVMLLKTALFLLVIWLLTSNTSIPNVILTIRKFSFISIVGVIACLAIRFVFLAIRMKYASWVAGIHLRLDKLIKWEFEILFLEVIIPLPDAEDLIRSFFWQKAQCSISGILTALLFSRVCGVLAIVLLLPFSFIMLGASFGDYFYLWENIIWLLPVITSVGVLAHKKLLRFVGSILIKIKHIPPQIAATIQRVAATDISLFKYIVGLFATYLQLGFIAAAFYVLTFNSGIEITYLQLFLTTPILLLAFTLPLSLQGLGLPETAMIWILLHFGANKEMATAVGVVHFACYILIILFGGLLTILFSKNRIADFKNALSGFKNRISPTFKAS